MDAFPKHTTFTLPRRKQIPGKAHDERLWISLSSGRASAARSDPVALSDKGYSTLCRPGIRRSRCTNLQIVDGRSRYKTAMASRSPARIRFCLRDIGTAANKAAPAHPGLPEAHLVDLPVCMPSTWPPRAPAVSIGPEECPALLASVSEAPLGSGEGRRQRRVQASRRREGTVPGACVVRNDQEMWGSYASLKINIEHGPITCHGFVNNREGWLVSHRNS